jgi:hypothetical protein
VYHQWFVVHACTGAGHMRYNRQALRVVCLYGLKIRY